MPACRLAAVGPTGLSCNQETLVACALSPGSFEPLSEGAEDALVPATAREWAQRSQSIKGQGTAQVVKAVWSNPSRAGLKGDVCQMSSLARNMACVS